MSETLHVNLLFESRMVTVTDVRCRPHEACCGGEEFSDSHEIVFPRSGLFVRKVGREETAADANSVLFFRRNQSYRVSHPIVGGDDCTTLSFAGETLLEAFATYDPNAYDCPDDPFPALSTLNGTKATLMVHHLRSLLLGKTSATCSLDALSADEHALRLLDVVAFDAAQFLGRRVGQVRESTRRAHRALAFEARVFLSERMRESQTLPDIARAVHSSPFHLARVFRRTTGLSLHKYLTRLRLREALQRLAGGESDLTRLAHSVGFSSHSHFSQAFRGEFNCPPGECRDLLASHRRNKTSTNLTA
ncbi:MAG: AraC family transcriptional regulator [Planctomycetota bacterium]|nr:AraC family transcriptional regulator [Planctomycetota bacterium]